MILILIPIGLVAAFAIAIALMTSVMRKVREIGLLVAMGGKQTSVGAIFCLQGFIIGSLGAVFGCALALLFIRYRDALMSLIVSNRVKVGRMMWLNSMIFTVYKWPILGTLRRVFRPLCPSLFCDGSIHGGRTASCLASGENESSGGFSSGEAIQHDSFCSGSVQKLSV